MDQSEIKTLIRAYYTSGQPASAVIPILDNIELNGMRDQALEYLHSLYAIKDSYYARNLTDTGNAERFVNTFGDILKYCYERKKWLIWTGQVWEWDNGSQVMNMAKDVARNIYAEAAKEDDDKKREQIAKHAHLSESEARRKAMLELAQSEIGIPVDIKDLDSNHWIINCLNGTVNLKTGELRPHNSRDLLTIMLPFNYEPAAKCDLWLKFLNRVMDNKQELIRYLQKAIGYSLTGDTREQCLFFLYGLGRNGKSTFIGILRKLMGTYGHKTTTDLFMTKDRSGMGPNEGLADLQGKRFVVASEIEDGRRLAVVLIKEMTGGESIRADRKYEHQFEFQPTHKIWLCGNHKPVITDTTYAIWRRFKLIPFTVTISDTECDPDLAMKLEKEITGIFSWAVRGCLEWQKEGLGETQEVRQATEAYRVEQDVLGEFMEDKCFLKPSVFVPKSELYQVYKKWTEDNNQPIISQRNFRGKIMERGITEGRDTSGNIRIWWGITLKGKEQVEQEKLILSSDNTDTSDGLVQEKTAVHSRVDTLLQNSVSSVSVVSSVRHKQLEYISILGCDTDYILDVWKIKDCPIVVNGCDNLEQLLTGPDATKEQLLTVRKWVIENG